MGNTIVQKLFIYIKSWSCATSSPITENNLQEGKILRRFIDQHLLPYFTNLSTDTKSMDRANTDYSSHMFSPSNNQLANAEPWDSNAFGQPQAAERPLQQCRPTHPTVGYYMGGEPNRNPLNIPPNSFQQQVPRYNCGYVRANASLGAINYMRYPVVLQPVGCFVVDTRTNPPTAIPVPLRPRHIVYNRPPVTGYGQNYNFSRYPSWGITYPRLPNYQECPRYYQPNTCNFYTQQTSVGNVIPNCPTPIPSIVERTNISTISPRRSEEITEEASLTPVIEVNEPFTFTDYKVSPTSSSLQGLLIEGAPDDYDLEMYRATATPENFTPIVVIPEKTIELREISPCNEIHKDNIPIKKYTDTKKAAFSPTIRRFHMRRKVPSPIFDSVPSTIFHPNDFPPLPPPIDLNTDEEPSDNKENVSPNDKPKLDDAELEENTDNDIEILNNTTEHFSSMTVNHIKEKPSKPCAFLIKKVHRYFKIKHVFNMVKGHGDVYKICRCAHEERHFVKYKVYFDDEEEARIAMVTLHGDNLRGFNMHIDFIVAHCREALEEEVTRNWNFREISCKLYN